MTSKSSTRLSASSTSVWRRSASRVIATPIREMGLIGDAAFPPIQRAALIIAPRGAAPLHRLLALEGVEAEPPSDHLRCHLGDRAVGAIRMGAQTY